jgi:hypothetical protein
MSLIKEAKFIGKTTAGIFTVQLAAGSFLENASSSGSDKILEATIVGALGAVTIVNAFLESARNAERSLKPSALEKMRREDEHTLIEFRNRSRIAVEPNLSRTG